MDREFWKLPLYETSWSVAELNTKCTVCSRSFGQHSGHENRDGWFFYCNSGDVSDASSKYFIPVGMTEFKPASEIIIKRFYKNLNNKL